MYVIAPVIGSTVAVPFEGESIKVTEVESIFPSLSVSLVRMEITTELFSIVVAISIVAFGPSFTGVTVITKVSLTQIAGKGSPLSQTLTIIVS